MSKTRRHTVLVLSIWVASILTGVAAVGIAQLTTYAQSVYFYLAKLSPYGVLVATPFLFLIATFLVRKFAPEAGGSGIPQVLAAMESGKKENSTEPWKSPLISVKTSVVKVFSILVGMMSGASVGREGPTVQIAVSIFSFINGKIRKLYPTVDFHTYLTAGAGAGVAAAFNTPLAGIMFAIEEIAEGVFGHSKNTVMVGVVIAGLTAQMISGDYLYFGHPLVTGSLFQFILEALVLGSLGGLVGGLLAKLVSHSFFPSVNALVRSFVCGCVCALLAFFTHQESAGSGYEVTRQALELATNDHLSWSFPITKFISTVFSYQSGMAGGVFAPILSLGAGLGLIIAKILSFINFKACALIGMVAVFGGAIQAPLTAVVIVMEMTDERNLVLPFIVAAFLGQALGRIFMPIPLYRVLVSKLLESKN